MAIPFLMLPLLLAPAMHAQGTAQAKPDEPPSAPENTNVAEPVDWFPKGPLGLKWVSIGVFVPVMIEPEIKNGSSVSGTTLPITKFTTTGQTSRVAVGLALEFPIYKHLTLVAEGIYHHISYKEVLEIDTVDTTNTAATTVTTFTQNTSAVEWQIPVMLRYTGFRSHGIFSKVYVEAGEAYRKVGHVKSTTNYDQSIPGQSDTTSVSNSPVLPQSRSMHGEQVGIGLRFMDDFNIRVEPEVRYVRWPGQVYDFDTTHTATRQLEVGVSFTF